MTTYEEFEVQGRYIWRDAVTSEETLGEISLFIHPSGEKIGKPMMPQELEIDGHTYIREDVAVAQAVKKANRAVTKEIENGTTESRAYGDNSSSPLVDTDSA